VKEPILSRTLLMDTLRDGTKMLLDWNLVETSLGTMLEPASISLVNGEATAAIDAMDAGFSKTLEIDEDTIQGLFNSGGNLLFRNFNV
jgi:hypothetical protein